MNSVGQVVFSEKNITTPVFELNLELSGVYWVHISNAIQQLGVSKLVIE